MLAERPYDEFLHYALALETINSGKSDEGIRILENLRKKSPDYLGLYYKLGQMYQLGGQFEKATEVYEAGIRLAEQKQQFKTRDELKNALRMMQDDLLDD
jgi:predicted Zn-dependent protease